MYMYITVPIYLHLSAQDKTNILKDFLEELLKDSAYTYCPGLTDGHQEQVSSFMM